MNPFETKCALAYEHRQDREMDDILEAREFAEEELEGDMKHTQGKWEAVFGEADGMGEFSVYQGESGTICRGDSEMVAWKANAHLIAAAPELLEACQMAKKYITLLEDHLHNQKLPLPHYDFCNQDILDMVEAAIAKTQGA
jgi:hypothetical protein